MILGSPHGRRDVCSETPRQQKPPDNHNMYRIVTTAPNNFTYEKTWGFWAKKVSPASLLDVWFISTPPEDEHIEPEVMMGLVADDVPLGGAPPPYSSGFSSRFHLPEIVQFWKVTLRGGWELQTQVAMWGAVDFHLRPLLWFWRLSLWATELEGIKRNPFFRNIFLARTPQKRHFQVDVFQVLVYSCSKKIPAGKWWKFCLNTHNINPGHFHGNFLGPSSQYHGFPQEISP